MVGHVHSQQRFACSLGSIAATGGSTKCHPLSLGIAFPVEPKPKIFEVTSWVL
jgi:hypothetical protein